MITEIFYTYTICICFIPKEFPKFQQTRHAIIDEFMKLNEKWKRSNIKIIERENSIPLTYKYIIDHFPGLVQAL